MARTSRPQRSAVGSGQLSDALSWSTLISTDELARHLEDPRFVIVDVRHDLAQPERFGEDAYANGHIPGAAFAHIDRDLSARKTGHNGRHPLPTPAAASGFRGARGLDAGRPVGACAAGPGAGAGRGGGRLRWLGHDRAAVLDGGFAKWTQEKRPVSTEPPAMEPATFVPSRVRPTVNATGIAASLPRHGLLLLDARAAERYRGDVEPMDPVAGHIPGALNRPYTRNVAADGTFRSPRELRSEFDAMLHGRPADDLVHYCGSGVTACHNVLAMAVAGYPLTRLYPGSWSEWITDRRRPVSKGHV